MSTHESFTLHVIDGPRRTDPLLGRDVSDLKARAEWPDGRVLIFRYERRYNERVPDEEIERDALFHLGKFISGLVARAFAREAG